MGKQPNNAAFYLGMDKEKEAVGVVALKVVQDATIEIAKNIIVGGDFAPGTPVKYGPARSSWMVGNSPSVASPNFFIDPSGSSALNAAISAIKSMKLGDSVFIVSAVPYMKKLEYGSSTQAPEGMVRITLASAQRILDRAVAKNKR